MRKTLAIGAALLAVSLPAEAATGRAMSLNAAVSVLKSGGGGDVAQLCGITRALGFIYDKTRRDVVLFGEADGSLPPLHLDDLAVALRNVNLLYAQVRGRTRYYAAPGCSIDPDPQTMRDLRALKCSNVADPEQVRLFEQKWDEIGRRPQKVRVMGVPFDSRFAKVMVDADYYMKRLVNGSVNLDIEGFASMSDLGVEQAKKAFTQGRSGSLGGYSMNRFWFSPGEAAYSEEDGAIVLRECRVQLLTEEEMLTQQGIKGKGRPGALAKEFASAFSAHYPEIAERRPVYTELEGLFRFVGLARIIREEGAASAGLDYLLKSHKIAVVPVSREVLGLTSHRHIDETLETSDGTHTFVMIMPSCGGVSMDVRPRKIASPAARVRPAAAPKPSSANSPRKPAGSAVRNPGPKPQSAAASNAAHGSLRKTVLGARQSSSAVSWDFELPTD